MRILIVAGNISARMGGEAILPYHYVRELAALGVDVHALTHARVREEIEQSPIGAMATFHYIEDSTPEIALFKAGKLAPAALRDTVFNSAIGATTMARLAHRARALENQFGFDIVHQPTPVSPQMPSFLSHLRAPVVIGPLNGGMDYPAAFEQEYAKGSKAAVSVARSVSGVSNQLISGKRRAARILVANERTLAALPDGVDRSRAEILVENGVDLDLWSPSPMEKPREPVFVYVGRLVWWKALELLIEAFAGLEAPARLVIIGDGEERTRLEGLAHQSAASARIDFLGFRPQTDIRDLLAASTALVLPSMRECGGAVVLEAFACRLPAIATDWGGPQDYITPETGFLIAPDSRDQFIRSLTDAMRRLADNPGLAERMGEAARRRVEAYFSWRAKAARMLEIYRETVKTEPAAAAN